MQREAITALIDVWELSPDVRLGQLMARLGFLGEGHVGEGLGYIEDDEIVSMLYRHRAELEARLDGPVLTVRASCSQCVAPDPAGRGTASAG